jgi:hypothetical protein
VVNSISELYTFMDNSDATLGRKVLGEGVDEDGEVHDHYAELSGGLSSAGDVAPDRHGCATHTVCFACCAMEACHGLGAEHSLVQLVCSVLLPAALTACCAGAAEEQAEARKKQEAEEYQRALYDIMSCMRDVRKRSERTDAMFEPLKETATLLHTFGIQLNDSVLKQLENAEFKWKGLKKKMLNRREQMAALQQAEAVEIRRKSDGFAERVDDYRKCAF